jgi:hypothetical protein
MTPRSARNTTYLFKLSQVVGREWDPYFAVQMALGALPLLILLGGSLSRRVGPRELRLRN